MKKKFLFTLVAAFMVAVTSVMPASISQTVFAQTPYKPTPYEEIESILKQHEIESDRVSVEVIGQSALGHDLYGVVIAETEDDLEQIKAMRKAMIQNPAEAKEWIKQNRDFKVPILINGSIHGNEYPGVDANLKLIERFAFENDEETMRILENNILIFNVVVNPDGRILGTRANGNGFDVNRDHVTLSQPEAIANVDLITEWNPMVSLDLHGFVRRSNDYPGLIEPCTIPHNPSYEYDLFIEFALAQAEAMEKELVENKEKFETDLYKNMKGTHIPYRDAKDGWDDYPPIFTPVYAMHHGVYGHTLETPNNTSDGVEWHYHAVMGALKYATENKIKMTENQIEIWRRGVEFDHPKHKEGFFPRAYILPVDKTDPTPTVKAVTHLLKHSVEVVKAKEPFTVDGKQYDKGTYIVKMNQGKASLANTLLWDGEDISDQADAMYDISAWNIPDLWGFEAIATHSSINVPVDGVKKIDINGELIGDGPYEIPNTSVAAIALVNKLLENNLPVYKGSNGQFYVENSHTNVLNEAVHQSGITVKTKAIPKDAQVIEKVNVAILNDGGQHGTRTALKQLGFQVTEVRAQDIAANGLDGYDVLVVNGSGSGTGSYSQKIQEFISNGGKYIAIGANASNTAARLGLTEAAVNTAGSSGRDHNGVVNVSYKGTAFTVGYGANDIGFVYNPAWYTNVEADRVIASYADQNFFKAGFWKNSQIAQGQPVMIKGPNPGVTLIGLEVGFRAHPEYLYRLITNAIYPGKNDVLTTVSGTKSRVERYAKEGAFKSDRDARALITHLTAVGLYEEKGQAEKVSKHLEGFKVLLEQQKANGAISDQAYNILKADMDALITKWQ